MCQKSNDLMGYSRTCISNISMYLMYFFTSILCFKYFVHNNYHPSCTMTSESIHHSSFCFIYYYVNLYGFNDSDSTKNSLIIKF